MAHHQCPTSAVAAECDTHRARQQACAQRYAHTARRGSVPACGHTVDELRRLQAYRKARQNTFMASAAADEGMRVLSDVPPELLSRPKVPYVVQSYRLDEQHQLHRVGSPDPTLRADRPPLVHAMPWGARHVRVSVPGRVGRQLRPDDVCGSNSAMLRRKRATSDESVSIYSHLRPGRSLPSHIANPKPVDSLDVRQQDGVPRPAQQCDPEQFLYHGRSRVASALAGQTLPDFRTHYDAEAEHAAELHPCAGSYHPTSCVELEKLSHLRAGLQVLHSRLWRRRNNPPSPSRGVRGRERPAPEGSWTYEVGAAQACDAQQDECGSQPGQRGEGGDAQPRDVRSGKAAQPGRRLRWPLDDGQYYGWLTNSPFPNL